MARSNVASRLLRYIQKAQSAHDVPEAADAWAEVFGLTGEDRSDVDFQVAEHLGILRIQLRLLRKALLARGLPRETWEDCTTAIGNTLNARHLGTKWAVVAQHLRADVLSALRLLPELLEDDGPELSDTEREAAIAALEELVTQFEQSGLPPEIVDFLRRQTDLARRAMEEYPLRGPIAIVEASDLAAQEWLVNAGRIAPYRSHPSVQSTFDLWPSIEKWGKRTLLIGGLAKLIFITGPELMARIGDLPTLPNRQIEALPPVVRAVGEKREDPDPDEPPK